MSDLGNDTGGSMNSSNWIEIATPDGRFDAYIARPVMPEAPTLVVIQEIFGINADLRETCDSLAGAGYIAVCPDLFWRITPHIELDHLSKADWQTAVNYYQAMNMDKAVQDVAATTAVARSLTGATGKVGVMGFCLGGLLTYLSAVRTPVEAAAAYYGGRTEEFLGVAGSLRTPLLMHLAGADEFMPRAAQEAILAALSSRKDVEIHVYPGCSHAFARNGGAHYDAEAAKLANSRTRRFFERWLR
jgi:carboxymethylenebutenolidase